MGDLIGKTHGRIRALHFRRDRAWLQSQVTSPPR